MTAQAAYPHLVPILNAAAPAYAAALESAAGFAAELERIRRGDRGLVGDPPARFEQEWFPRLDAVATYVTVRRARPRRILEIGSGHSTRFMAQAIHDGDLPTALVCVDPRPRAPIAALRLRHEARPFGDAEVEAVAAFEPGDILFVDSSHVAAPGTDVDRIILDALPRLRGGVLVHFHDIFLPDPYPAGWNRRGYNEQTVVGALILGGGFDILFASRHVATRTGLIENSSVATLPLSPDTFESSLWLRRRALG